MNHDRMSNWSILCGYIDDGIPVQVPFNGTPWSSVIFNPRAGSLSLFIESVDGVGAAQPPSDISVSPGVLDLRVGWYISTSRRELFFHFYCFVCAVADEMLLRLRSLHDAFEITVDSFRDLIEKETVLSDEKQIGLLAELLVLIEIAKCRPWSWCLNAWHSDANAEHDFNLGATDLEVKATMLQSRSHMVGSLQQLDPSIDRKLHLASFQFTRDDHADAMNLANIVKQIADLIELSEPQSLAALNNRLHRVGYRSEHERFYSVGTAYRDAPLVFDVDDDFPRLVRSTLVFQNSSLSPRIGQVSYRINLDGLLGQNLNAHLASTIGE